MYLGIFVPTYLPIFRFMQIFKISYITTMLSHISDFVKEALSLKKYGHTASQALIWGSVNFTFFIIFAANLHSTSYNEDTKLFYWSMFGASCVCLLNFIVHTKSYLVILFTITPLEISEKQRKLLSVSDHDWGFRSASPPKRSVTSTPAKHPTMSELFEATMRPAQSLANTSNLNSSMKSWYGQNVSFNSTGFSSSPSHSYFNTSISPVAGQSLSSCSSASANSWTYRRQSSLLNGSYNIISSPRMDDSYMVSDPTFDLSTSFCSPITDQEKLKRLSLSPVNSLKANLFNSPSVTTREELEEYLTEVKDKERNAQILLQAKSGNGGNSSLWSFGGSVNVEQEFLNGLRKNVYHPAVKDTGPETTSMSSQNEDSIANAASISVSKIWLDRKVSQRLLFQYEENLRIWISNNILQPIVNNIDLCNKTLSATAPELKIGDVGIDKLKKAAINISGVKQLNNLLPFLDLTLHQDYLVHRLRELAKGGAISSYQWNAGGSFNGKPWRDELPTDSFILLHLFALYMDAHLPPDPTQADGRVFSNLHLVKTPEKPPKPAAHPCLYLCQINPPHIKVALPGEEEECDVGAGHKNFLYSLLLFCHHLVHKEHSHIAGVDLRLSGINLAWVLNED